MNELLQDRVLHFHLYFQILKHPPTSIPNAFSNECFGRLTLFSANNISTIHFLCPAENGLEMIVDINSSYY